MPPPATNQGCSGAGTGQNDLVSMRQSNNGNIDAPIEIEADAEDFEDNSGQIQIVNTQSMSFDSFELPDSVLDEQFNIFEQSQISRAQKVGEKISDEAEEYNSESDTNDELTDFSDPELEFDKHDLFCEEDVAQVKKNLEGTLMVMDSHITGDVEGNLFEKDVDSDELITDVDSSGEECSVMKNRYTYFNEKTGFCKDINLSVGLQFRNKKIFIKALNYCAVMRGFDFDYKTNGTQKVAAQCRKDTCPWRVHASWYKDEAGGKSFMIKTWVPHHDCPRVFNNSKVTTKFLAEYYLHLFRNNPKWEAAGFYAYVRSDLEVNVSRSKCDRARQKALKIVEGSVGDQFKLLRQYCGAIIKWNPGSTVALKIDGGRFQRVYICLDACKRGFLVGCRPIISLDSCHLKGHYTGQIHSAVGRDGNDNMFPICWAICEAESKDTWLWFLDNLLHDIGEPSEHSWSFISDQQKGLREALKENQPRAEHRLCVRHIYANFKKKFKGKELKDAMWACARATTKGEFVKKMNDLKELDCAAYSHMMQFEPGLWSRHAFKAFSHCDTLTSNISECFNAYIKDAREQPIVTCLESIRLQLMKRFQEKHTGMEKFENEIMPRPFRKLTDNKQHSFHYQVHWNGGRLGFQVARSDWDGHVVDLNNYSCDCNLWSLTGIPCVHACAAIFHINDIPDKYVHHSYKKQQFLLTYEAFIMPIPGPMEWPIVNGDGILPPLFKRQQGRPKKRRIREVDEPINPNKVRKGGGQITCSVCNVAGHNKTTCEAQVSNPKRYMDGQKAAARAALNRRRKKSSAEGTTSLQPIPTAPKKFKVKRKSNELVPTTMRDTQASNQTTSICLWTTSYESASNAFPQRNSTPTGPVFMGQGMFTRPLSNVIRTASSDIVQDKGK